MKFYDAVVAGGGVIGASIALELASEGMSVAVFDAQNPGLEASWASAGMISPAPEGSEMASLLSISMASVHLYPEFIQRVEELSGRSVGYRNDGALDLLLDGTGQAEMDEILALHRGAGLRAEALSGPEAREIEPALTGELRAAIHRPDEASLDNRLFTEATLEAARRKGAEIFPGNGAKALLTEGNVCKGLQLQNGRVEARWTVIAAGCFSARIEGVASYAPVTPAKGQMMALRCDAVKLRKDLWSGHMYLVPRHDGRIIAGSTVEYEGFDRSVTVAGMKKILSGAISLVPALESARIEETWAGLRPDSPDHLPILGPTDLDGLLIATGHFRSGILLTPVTARLIREWVTTQKVSEDWAPFSPMRFQQARQTRGA
ncbi:MAG TPA: glycine oxidase ThiO [Candidatus Acidoferrales bacterium]|jgi:glycine oxidase|nr:glycine oxidase ThiO [Candidatus Acidoferrales bacterium]